MNDLEKEVLELRAKNQSLMEEIADIKALNGELSNLVDVQQSSEVLIDKRWRIHDDGTATDILNGLQWMRFSVGEKWDYDQQGISGERLIFHGSEANEVLENYPEYRFIGGYTDWRLPTNEELFSLLEFAGKTGSEPKWNQKIFGNPLPENLGFTYWSGTGTGEHNIFWVFSFDTPWEGDDGKDEWLIMESYETDWEGCVRLVRSVK